jgi:phosphoribosylformimino-5-aminoimidazole carboxamide ribotide isomerase
MNEPHDMQNSLKEKDKKPVMMPERPKPEKSQEMIIYPAIDLLDGRCVRLSQGRYDQVTVYHEQPLEVARQFCAAGASWLHVVDLEAARSGKSAQTDLIAAIRRETGLKIQTGGGIRTMATLELLLETHGLDRAVLGTAAVRDRAFTEEALARYGERIAIGVDARDGKVCIEGWTEDSGLDAVAFARTMAASGARTLIFTDIRRDGMMHGPAVGAIRELTNLGLFDVIASGGIGSHEDIEAVRGTGAAGVIVGKAIYERKVVLSKCWPKESSPASM